MVCLYAFVSILDAQFISHILLLSPLFLLTLILHYLSTNRHVKNKTKSLICQFSFQTFNICTIYIVQSFLIDG